MFVEKKTEIVNSHELKEQKYVRQATDSQKSMIDIKQ